MESGATQAQLPACLSSGPDTILCLAPFLSWPTHLSEISSDRPHPAPASGNRFVLITQVSIATTTLSQDLLLCFSPLSLVPELWLAWVAQGGPERLLSASSSVLEAHSATSANHGHGSSHQLIHRLLLEPSRNMQVYRAATCLHSHCAQQDRFDGESKPSAGVVDIWKAVETSPVHSAYSGVPPLPSLQLKPPEGQFGSHLIRECGVVT